MTNEYLYQFSEIMELRKKEQAIIVQQINEKGFCINELYDLINNDINFIRIIPDLYKIINGDNSEGIKAILVEAIGKYAGSEFYHLMDLYKKTSNNSLNLKEALANELFFGAKNNKSYIKDVEDLLLDKNNGKSRIILLELLKSSKDEGHTQLLKKLALDSDLRSNIITWKSYWMKRDPDLYIEWGEDRRLIKERLRLLLKEEDRLKKEQLRLADMKR